VLRVGKLEAEKNERRMDSIMYLLLQCLKKNVSRNTSVVNRVKNSQKSVRFQVLTAASMKLRIFWDVLPCS
jgi:hypothetical protein